MNRSISHIAWTPDQEPTMIDFVIRQGITLLELAPLRTFGHPLQAVELDVRGKRSWYHERGCSISSFQALLFGVEGVALFEDADSRQRMKEWLIAVGRVAGWCGAGPMVFGSPKNRLKGEMSCAQAMEIAIPFFREVGDSCAAFGSCLVMEANPEAYGADFCTTLSEAAELVDAVNSPGFRLHIDAGGLALSGEDFVPVILQSGHLIAHVHASQPHLSDWAQPHEVHATIADALQKINYSGTVAIEMKMQEDVVSEVEKAIKSTREIYAPVLG